MKNKKPTYKEHENSTNTLIAILCFMFILLLIIIVFFSSLHADLKEENNMLKEQLSKIEGFILKVNCIEEFNGIIENQTLIYKIPNYEEYVKWLDLAKNQENCEIIQ